MRTQLSVLGMILCAACLGQDPAEPEAMELTYREPFSTLSASEVESKLVVLLITDEDPFVWTEERLKSADENRLGGGPDLWCGSLFRSAYQKMVQMRPDLKGRCLAQRVVAGHPTILNGGHPSALPPRVFVAICDGEYRLLNLCVGLPDAEGMITLLEDAEENRTLLSLNENDKEKVGEALVQRANERMFRVYRDPLAILAEEHGWDDMTDIDPKWISNYAAIVTDLHPVYIADVKLRFGLGSAGDLVRLIVLEQHIQTRRDWGEAVAPFIIGRPFEGILSAVVGSVWNISPVWRCNPESHKELLDWFDLQREQSIVTLAIEPPLLDRTRPWPPPNVGTGKAQAKRDWKALQTAMAEYPFRTVSAEELAVLMHAKQIKPFPLNAPTPARYVFFEPTKERMFVIREGDLPGKFLSRYDK